MSTVKEIDGDTDIKVEDIADFQVGYVLTSTGKTVRFMPHVPRLVKASELRELSWQHGGLYLLQNYLRVYNRDLAMEFGISEDTYDHEYQWTEKDVDDCLLRKDIDVLLDALDFAPQGIVDTLKDRAIELEIPDTNKLRAIGRKTGSDLEAMIANKHAYDNVEEDNAQDETPKRRRVSSNSTPQRRRRAS